MRSEAWRPAAAARNRSPREAREVARQALRPGCEELALRIRVMPETEARPRVKNRHGGAPRGERPASWQICILRDAPHASIRLHGTCCALVISVSDVLLRSMRFHSYISDTRRTPGPCRSLAMLASKAPPPAAASTCAKNPTGPS